MSSYKINNTLNTVYNKDARSILDTIPSDIKIATTITSPPYFDMKDYNSDDQVGYGQTYDDYLNDLKLIFSGVYEITEEDGSLWIIIDTFKREGQVVTLPFDLSSKLKEIGWLLQDVIIWKKDKTVPWSMGGFMQRKFEYILFFTKSAKYKSNKDNVRVYDTAHLKKWWVKYPERYNPKGKALDEVWEFPIPVQGSWGDKYIRHFCPLPTDMVATMIQLSTNENDIVLDPFAGSGTVLSQSAYMKRNYIGFETNKDYIEMFTAYLQKTIDENSAEYELASTGVQDDFENTILNLRALKYARVLVASIQKKLAIKDIKVIVVRGEKSTLRNKLIKVTYRFITLTPSDAILAAAESLINKQPLSKFGIEPSFDFVQIEEIDLTGKNGYTITNTYSFNKQLDLLNPSIKVISEIKVDLNEKDYL
ncbi:site-specific DNA-methyltransferase [Pedobacter riviphilus]|uniref:Methyltransferase n=1 Tax=Pedobacter riviphilus TaxID=2766984 RepID=A0ABX6TIE8_9SPHI|nr:site-specific DNA-methyltransferase [Pedobacter riviphilus]QNR85082.1 site-specific DNA-methyltransferase [Pedobacter riviphilus]